MFPISFPFNLLSVDNNYYSLETLKGKNGTLIAFICNHCPYVIAIADRFSYEANQLSKIGINFTASENFFLISSAGLPSLT